MMNEIMLEMNHISKAFGGNQALKNVHFSCTRGTVHVLAGENGAGKSTLLKVIAGIHQADKGEIFLNGKQVSIHSPLHAQELGIAMVFQELTLIGELTVEENLYLNVEPRKHGLIDRKSITASVRALMKEYGINIDPKAIAGRLSVAEQQMAEILKVLLKSPELIILDEPTSSLAIQEVEKLFQIIRNLVEKGKTILFISHRMEEIFEIGDDVTVFKDGEFIGTRKLKEIDKDELIRMMVGRPLQNVFPQKAGTIGNEIIFRAEHITGSRLKDISFCLKKGEGLGIAGLQGHGQTELLNALSGLYPLKQGSLEIMGKVKKIRNAGQAIREGIALVPGDRKREGLMLILPIQHNLAVCSLKKRMWMGFINLKKERQFAQKMKETLNIKAYRLGDPVYSLSGGNQQKVVLGKELAILPRIILFNDPTRGIDVEAKSDFYKIMRDLANQGIGVILCSSDMMEIIGMSDRVLVMYEGAISAQLKGQEIEEEIIMRCAMGLSSDG